MGTFTSSPLSSQIQSSQNLFEIYELVDTNHGHTLTLEVTDIEGGGQLEISSLFTFGNDSVTYVSSLIILTFFIKLLFFLVHHLLLRLVTTNRHQGLRQS